MSIDPELVKCEISPNWSRVNAIPVKNLCRPLCWNYHVDSESFMENQHCENDYTTQSNLQIQCNPYQTTHDIFHRTRTNSPKIHMQPQKIPNCQRNLERKEQRGRHHPPRIQKMLQSYSNQNSMLLSQKQTQRSMDRIGCPKINWCTYNQLIYKKRGKNILWRKDSLFNKRCLENRTATCKTLRLEFFLMPYTKNKLKMD